MNQYIKAAEAMGMNLERYLLVHGISASPVPEASAPPQALTNNNYNEDTSTHPPNPAAAAWNSDLQRYISIEEHQRWLLAQLEEGEVERIRLLERLSLGPVGYGIF